MIDDVGPDHGRQQRRQYIQGEFREVFQHGQPLPASVLMRKL
jgi:hypothetical protein